MVKIAFPVAKQANYSADSAVRFKFSRGQPVSGVKSGPQKSVWLRKLLLLLDILAIPVNFCAVSSIHKKLCVPSKNIDFFLLLSRCEYLILMDEIYVKQQRNGLLSC